MARILIVEDDPDIRQLLVLQLRSAGHETTVAGDGVSAISAARKSEPEVILLDLGLPAGDGYSIMERLQSFPALAHVPIVVVSARSPTVDGERALGMGVRSFVHKPFTAEQILAAVDDALSA
jgi:CheY-like chemotaxis protein